MFTTLLQTVGRRRTEHGRKLSCPSLALADFQFLSACRAIWGAVPSQLFLLFSSTTLAVVFACGRGSSSSWLSGRNMSSCHVVFGTDATLRVASKPCENAPFNTHQHTETTARLVEWLAHFDFFNNQTVGLELFNADSWHHESRTRLGHER